MYKTSIILFIFKKPNQISMDFLLLGQNISAFVTTLLSLWSRYRKINFVYYPTQPLIHQIGQAWCIKLVLIDKWMATRPAASGMSNLSAIWRLI